MSNEVVITVIGAGVIGLTIADKLTASGREVLIVEKNPDYGLETSSRNSQVIHGGLYYPAGSLKAKLCVEGRSMLYHFCQENNINHQKCGKLVVAVNDVETVQLEKIAKQAKDNGVNDIKWLTRQEINALEPEVKGVCGLLSPSTGIFDSHAYMSFCFYRAKRNGGLFAFNHEITGINQVNDKYLLQVRNGSEVTELTSWVVINCAGLSCEKIARLAGIDTVSAGYHLHYCKGQYFMLRGDLEFKRLIYPTTEQAGLGIHVTPDTEGNIRLGPDTEYIDYIDYQVNENSRPVFYHAVKRFIPRIRIDDLTPDFTGIRPKLQGPGDDFRDFVINREQNRGLNGFINLIGIESPGLTASPAIAKFVCLMVEEILS